LVPAVVFAVGLGLIIASLNVRYRDTERLVEVTMIAWFWLNPIVYGAGLIRAQLHGYFWLYMRNPMGSVVGAAQRAIYREPYYADSGTGERKLLPDAGMVYYLNGSRSRSSSHSCCYTSGRRLSTGCLATSPRNCDGGSRSWLMSQPAIVAPGVDKRCSRPATSLRERPANPQEKRGRGSQARAGRVASKIPEIPSLTCAITWPVNVIDPITEETHAARHFSNTTAAVGRQVGSLIELLQAIAVGSVRSGGGAA
jgi:hypothetical protein